jgi:proline-specific peptidase
MEAVLDGIRIFYQAVGSPDNYPLIVLHGGPGLDHTEMCPWLDPLSDDFYLIYLDERGQGRSEQVDPSTLSLSRFAADVTEVAAAMGLPSYALLGHSFGAFIALTHAVEWGDASHYIISGGTASFTKTSPELEANLANFEPVELRELVIQSWEMEPSVKTREDCARLMQMQMPFHFATTTSDAYHRYMALEDRCIYSPQVLAYFAANQYAIELENQLSAITRPTLLITGEFDRTCTVRAARDMHAGIRDSELVIVPEAGHMTFVEQPDAYFTAVRGFFSRHPMQR